MRLRVLDVHADGCPHGGDECEHYDKELHPNETVAITLSGHILSSASARPLHSAKCEVLTVHRDDSDNVKIIVNGLDYQAKALRLAQVWNDEEQKIAAGTTVSAMLPRRSGISTLLWLIGCFALIGVQAWATHDGSPGIFVLASAALILAVSLRV